MYPLVIENLKVSRKNFKITKKGVIGLMEGYINLYNLPLFRKNSIWLKRFLEAPKLITQKIF